VAAKTEVLDYLVVSREEGSHHKTDLKRRVNCDAPHFEGCKEVGESSLEGDDGFVLGLLYVNEIKNVAK
jgi:hypothetical protein